MLTDQIKADMTASLKAAEGLRVQTLRMLLSEINYEQIRLQRDVTDSDILNVLAREVKKRKEAIASYEAANRVEQANNERVEMEILQEYMPKMLDENELRIQLKEVIKGLGAPEKNNFGMAMKSIAPMFKGKADGATVAKIVQELVSNGNL